MQWLGLLIKANRDTIGERSGSLTNGVSNLQVVHTSLVVPGGGDKNGVNPSTGGDGGSGIVYIAYPTSEQWLEVHEYFCKHTIR